MKRTLITLLFFCLLPFRAVLYAAGGGDIVFTPDDPHMKRVLFSHDLHIQQKGIKCGSCHYQIFQMAKGSYKMKMEMITKGEFCGSCHNGESAFDVKDKANCKRCHNR